jgi:hypothetical protein
MTTRTQADKGKPLKTPDYIGLSSEQEDREGQLASDCPSVLVFCCYNRIPEPE